jgi:hypothetical protein
VFFGMFPPSNSLEKYEFSQWIEKQLLPHPLSEILDANVMFKYS